MNRLRLCCERGCAAREAVLRERLCCERGCAAREAVLRDVCLDIAVRFEMTFLKIGTDGTMFIF
jgi:hypothetical protein